MMRFIHQITIGVTGRDGGKDNNCTTKVREEWYPQAVYWTFPEWLPLWQQRDSGGTAFPNLAWLLTTEF